MVSINGSATQPDLMYAELIVSWDFMPGSYIFGNSSNIQSYFPEPRTEPNYFILDTDYTSYSIVYDCKQLAEDSMKGFTGKVTH